MVDRQEIEDRVEASGLNAPRLTIEHITSLIDPDKVVYWRPDNGVFTVCAIQLPNGTYVIGTSAPASPENFQEKLGRKIAFDKAMDKIWELEGYLLRQQLSEGSGR